MEWISVKDRLPETDEAVITSSSNTKLALAFYMGVGRVLKEGWWELVDGTVEELEEVTHWMPLPEPP